MSDENPRLECGRTLDDVSAYWDLEGAPPDAHIAACPYCQNALDALRGSAEFARSLVAADAAELPEPPDTWLAGIMDAIALDLRSGRALPITHPDPRVEISLDEGAVKSLLRSVGDAVEGAVVGSVTLDGDVETPGAPVVVALTLSVRWPEDARLVSERLRSEIARALQQHTELHVTRIDIEIVDVHGYRPKEQR